MPTEVCLGQFSQPSSIDTRSVSSAETGKPFAPDRALFIEDEPERPKDLFGWGMVAVRHLAASPDFVPDPEWVHKRLRGKVTQQEAQFALRILQECGFLRKTEQGWELHAENIATSAPHGHKAIRHYHEQFLSLTLNFDFEKMAEAKSFLRDFMLEFHAKFHQSNARGIAQINLQLFALSTEE